jgi:hypothetical protein
VIGRWLKRPWRKRHSSRLDELPLAGRREAEQLLAELRCKNLTYVGPAKLRNLAWSAITVRESGIEGVFVEAGVALGGSAILLAKLKPPGTPLLLYDVFATIPPPGDKDGPDAHARYSEIARGRARGLGEGRYYGYVEDLVDVVRGNLRQFGVGEATDQISLIEGLFEETLHPPGPVALAHIDCDWYESVKVCIARIYPLLSAGGIMVFDDYRSYSGCRTAVDEFLLAHRNMAVVFDAKSVGVRKP